MKKLKNILRNIFRKKPKLIELTKYEKQWILLCKGHYKDIYRTNASNWIDTLKPLFEEIYGYDPNKSPADFKDCMFNKLLDILLKITDHHSEYNQQLKTLFDASFYRSCRRDYELPIERAIAELCGQIQSTTVIKDEVKRFDLTID